MDCNLFSRCVRMQQWIWRRWLLCESDQRGRNQDSDTRTDMRLGFWILQLYHDCGWSFCQHWRPCLPFRRSRGELNEMGNGYSVALWVSNTSLNVWHTAHICRTCFFAAWYIHWNVLHDLWSISDWLMYINIFIWIQMSVFWKYLWVCVCVHALMPGTPLQSFKNIIY